MGLVVLTSKHTKAAKTADGKTLSKIAAQHKDRKAAIIAAYKKDAYGQREIGEFYQLHSTTIGILLHKIKNSWLWT